MAGVFISHSSENKELVKIFLDFLQMGMGVKRDEIFCTSLSDSLPTGEAFIPKIKEELKGCEAVIFLITEQYLKSLFCIAEMGAAWGLGKRIYPLLTVDVQKLDRTPLKGIQMRHLDNKNDMSVLYDEFYKYGINQGRCTAEYTERMPEFIQKVKMLLNGEYILPMDSEGYYHTEICAVRDVPAEYRCYQIKGHTEEWRGADRAKSDWLLFRHKVYEDLEIGDKVRFKISKKVEKFWKDIGIARNIYPADLRKEE